VTTVASIIGLPEPKKGDVGMELEVEGLRPLPQINEKKWRSKEDGSLRGYSMEYYNSEPVRTGDTLHPRIKYLTDKLAEPELGVYRDSPRTSFHVHNNVSGFTPVQVWTSAAAFWLLENLLVKFCDAGSQTREGNCFCLRLADAEASMPYLLKDLKQPRDPFLNCDNDRIRYMGLNLSAVRRFGSLETRTMRGTVDPDVLAMWAQENFKLISTAPNFFISPAHLLDEHHRQGSEAIMSMLLSPEFVRVLTQYPDWKESIAENAGLLCELAYFHDWGRYSDRVDKLHEGAIREAPALRARARPRDVEGNILNNIFVAADNPPGFQWAHAPREPEPLHWNPLPQDLVHEWQQYPHRYELRQLPSGDWEFRNIV